MAHEHLGSRNPTRSSIVHFANLPPLAGADDATRIIEPEREVEPSYVLVQSAPPLRADECEEIGVTALEVSVLWGTNVLHVAHLAPARAFAVGHGEGARVDFVLPNELAAFARAEIVTMRAGAPHVVVPDGAQLSWRSRAQGVASGAHSARLSEGDLAEMRFGQLAFRIAAVAAGRRVPRHIGGDASGLGASFAATLTAVGAFLGILAYYTPALGSSLDGDLDPEKLLLMHQYLNAQAEKEQKERPNEGERGRTEGGGTPGQAAQGPEGKMGRPNRPETGKRSAIAGSGELQLSRSEAIAEAANFGLVGMLNTLNARSVPHALWGSDVPNGPDTTDAWGALFGEGIGESGGAGGLGLSGPGQGAGGLGKGIGLGNIGTCGTNCGMGPGGWGVGIGRGGDGGHTPKGPSVRMASATIVSGRLPPEVIQRVVRQNYGRFRQCYESGLRANPNLTGRVAARFVIGRDGGVSNVANGGSDLPDSKVVSCVVNAFYGITFPAPQDGIVSVTYPIMLVPG